MPAERFGYVEGQNIGFSTPYVEGYFAGGVANTETLSAVMTQQFTGILPAFDNFESIRFTNLDGSGIMFDENWNTWRYLMGRSGDDRDRARRHIVGWNARAVAALAGQTRDDVEEVHRVVHNVARDEWLATHGWRHLGQEWAPINVWINDIVAVVGSALSGPLGTLIFGGIGAVLDPVLRFQDKWMGEETTERQIKNSAIIWLNDMGIPVPPMAQDLDWLLEFTRSLQAIADFGTVDVSNHRWSMDQVQSVLYQLRNLPKPPVVVILDPSGAISTIPVGSENPVPGDLPATDPGGRPVGISLAAATPSEAPWGKILVVGGALAALFFWG